MLQNERKKCNVSKFGERALLVHHNNILILLCHDDDDDIVRPMMILYLNINVSKVNSHGFE